MASAFTTKITEATTARKMLNGIVCLYKPIGWGSKNVMKQFRIKMCNDLNQMQPPPRQEIVEMIRMNENDKASRIPLENEQVVCSVQDGSQKIEVIKGLGYSDHPLITGPRFIPKDISMVPTGRSGMDITGVHLYGVNNGISTAMKIYHSRWIRTYLVSGMFGIATDTNFHTGRVLQKTTYGSIKRQLFERFLASSESTHQRMSFLASGVPLESEQAYEIACKGLVRPDSTSDTMIYSLKCIHFNLPHFTIEVKVINENPEYLKFLIHDLGLRLRSTATCTKIQCTNVGPFGLKDALLFKHWTLENALSNINYSREILKSFNLNQRELLVDKPSENWEDEVDDERQINDIRKV